MLNTGGDGSSYIKYTSRNKIEIVTGDSARVTVQDGTTTVANDLAVTGDLNAGGGRMKGLTFFKNGVEQGARNMTMTASIMSGNQSAGQGNYKVFTKIPCRAAGSSLGVTLYTENCTVKSGSLTGTVYVDGSPTAAKVMIATGTVASQTFTKDTYTFAANQTISLVLSGASGYHDDIDATSGSFMAIVDVEY
jgi:hypothetical protein